MTYQIDLKTPPRVGSTVEVVLHGFSRYTGRIDGVTEDGEVLWVLWNGQHRRCMFVRQPDTTVWTTV